MVKDWAITFQLLLFFVIRTKTPERFGDAKLNQLTLLFFLPLNSETVNTILFNSIFSVHLQIIFLVGKIGLKNIKAKTHTHTGPGAVQYFCCTPDIK